MRILKKITDKRFIGILLAVIILFNVISPDIVIPKAYAADIAGILLFPLTFLVTVLAQGAIAIISTISSVVRSGRGSNTTRQCFYYRNCF